MIRSFALFILFIIIQYCFINYSIQKKYSTVQNLKESIYKLNEKINEEQNLEDISFRTFPLRFAEQKGIYKSYIHLNMVGSDLENTMLRRYFKIPDMNMFVTNFILLAQLESQYLSNLTLIDSNRLNLAINAILSYKDKNFKETTPIYNFWPQQKVITPDGRILYSAFPKNLVEPIKEFGSLDKFLDIVLKSLGLGHLAEKVDDIVATFQILSQAFHIPADYDDTSVNLALGGNLKHFLNINLNNNNLKYLNIINNWLNENKNVNELFNEYTKYAYHYNSTNIENTFIDPRSFYMLHSYFNSKKGEDEIILPMTWMMNINENINNYPNIAMPFNINNIDLTVLSNFLYGIISHTIYISNLEYKNNLTLQKMLISTSKLIEYVILNKLELNRPDLILVYYPSIYDMYWFLSRTNYLLNNYNLLNHLKYFKEVNFILDNLLKNSVTKNLLNLVKCNNEEAYWDDFLGDYNTTNYGEDRIFSTSLAINTLFDIWTIERVPTKREFINTTPQQVKDIINKGITYLNHYIFEYSSSKENAFFSGSIKGTNDYPFYYPMNVCNYLNGTKINPNLDNGDAISSKLMVGVQGMIDENVYNGDLMKRKWFGGKVPVDGFKGFQYDEFPYWSSPGLTYSITQLVFTKYRNVYNLP
ncbi:hypothetical protein ABK040_001962 [Willaertia magna]